MKSSSPLPYDLTENDVWSYSFKTRDGIVYHAYFIDFSNYHPAFSDVRGLCFTEDYTLYVSIYLHKANPRMWELVSAFYDLVKNDLYPID